MGFTRGIPLLLLLFLLTLITCADIAEAGFLGGLKGAFKGLADKVKGFMSDAAQTRTKKFSVLSKFFGDGTTRADLTLPQIFNSVFSRNNGIAISNANVNAKEGDLEDGSNVIAAMSTGGAISVTTNGGVVSITTGTTVNANKEHSKEGGSDNDTDGPQETENENEESQGKDNSIEANGNGTSSVADIDKKDGTGSLQHTDNGGMTFSGSDVHNASIQLLSDWDKFVTSSIWDAQEQRELEPTTEDPEDEESLRSSSRIVNGVFLGNRIVSGAPFAVKFFYNNEENFYCSGSLIGYPYALTAAHCGVLLGDEGRIGGHLLRSGLKATVDEVSIHPKFNPASLIYDVAVVRLDGLDSRKVLKGNGVEAARINRNDSFPDTNFVGVVSAHGSVRKDGQGVSHELRSTRHSAYDLDKCREEITQGNVRDEETYLCAGDGERSTTCVGDSGAGLWRYRVKSTASGKIDGFYEIFGVVSFGEVTDEALCPPGPPTVFQKTSTIYEWIQEVVGKKNMP